MSNEENKIDGIIAVDRLAEILGQYRNELAKNNITGELSDSLVFDLQTKILSDFSPALVGEKP